MDEQARDKLFRQIVDEAQNDFLTSSLETCQIEFNKIYESVSGWFMSKFKGMVERWVFTKAGKKFYRILFGQQWFIPSTMLIVN
jgi:hypothetical protein